MTQSQELFLELIQISLGNREASLSAKLTADDWNRLYALSQNQTVLGLVLCGLERLPLEQLPPRKPILMQWIGAVQMVEAQNAEMNAFVCKLFEWLHEAHIEAILVKGQGIAQCYEMPLRRQCGDVDLVLDFDNYHRAKILLSGMAQRVDEENPDNLHLAMAIDGWTVELHGTLRNGLWRRMNLVVDEVLEEMFLEKQFRDWINGEVIVSLPSANNDVFFVFSHLLQHFFKEGIGMRQICDWCLLLSSFKGTIDNDLLKRRLQKSGVMSEWRVLGSLAVDWLGMPIGDIPFYSTDNRWKRRANRVVDFIMETGNFGYNRDYSYYRNNPKAVYKLISFGRHCRDCMRYARIFPFDSLKVWFVMIRRGIKTIIKGK